VDFFFMVEDKWVEGCEFRLSRVLIKSMDACQDFAGSADNVESFGQRDGRKPTLRPTASYAGLFSDSIRSGNCLRTNPAFQQLCK
jgi:hypothetical protein